MFGFDFLRSKAILLCDPGDAFQGGVIQPKSLTFSGEKGVFPSTLNLILEIIEKGDAADFEPRV